MNTLHSQFGPANQSKRRRASWRNIVGSAMLGLVAGIAAVPAQSAVVITQRPLFLPQDVPGNLVLTPSVEWPTINVAAYKGAFAASGTSYTGLFDSRFCYQYNVAALEQDRYFEPMANADANGACTGTMWSGKFLNWASTQAIEPFRIALTGGNRVRDTATVTWIQKARQDGQGGVNQFPNRNVTDAALIDGYTPATSGWAQLQIRIQGLGSRMYFTSTGNLGAATGVPYAPNGLLGLGLLKSPLDATDQATVYEVSMRVQVCKPGFLGANCVAYGSNYKPEGLIQEYSRQLRYSAFGYLSDSSMLRDGAVLRARQKFVGPQTHDPLAAPASNPAAEWDATTGILFQNPNPTDASAAAVTRSGVINFINKFSEDGPANHKSFDPVSEMYYAATRYIRNIGNVSAYTSSLVPAMKDNFPVITEWNDPIQYRCQANVILGIGDAYTHRDKNLPGATNGTDEPTKPAEVVADTQVDVIALTNQVAAMEGISIPTGASFSGRNNSAFIAGLAYDAHVRDQRGDLDGKQTVSTYWVDVREFNGRTYLEPRATNQYWLATKYGGFRVPDGYTAGTAPALGDWYNNSDVLETGDRRPDNFFVAANPDAMIAGLKQAFAKIADEVQLGSGAALGATSTSLQAGTSVYQATFRSGEWSGDLASYALDPDTGSVLAETWRASAKFSALAAANANWWQARNVYMSASGARVDFTYANVSANRPGAGLTQQAVDYLRGDRLNEQYLAGRLRPRAGVLGDIVNSQPLFVDRTTASPGRPRMVYVGANDGMLHAFNADTGEEVFAFVPKAAITTKLRDYTLYSPQGYAHQYFVDGELTAANVVVAGVERTYLVGTMGRGSPGAFALDVTDPTNMSVLWDRTGGTGGDMPALGNSVGKPVIAEVAAGDWRAVLGNGANSSTGRAAILSIGLNTAGTVSVVTLGTSTDNGLTAPVVWRGTNSYFNTVYAGDLTGTLWKVVNIHSATPTSTALYAATTSAGVAQPITAAPQVAIRPNSGGEVWVFFGTGKYLSAGDISDKQVQTWYGIKDGAAFSGRSNLVQRQIIAEEEVVVTADDPGTPQNERVTKTVRAVSTGDITELASKRGWYMDLVPPSGVAQGERMVVPNIFQGLALVGTTRIPKSDDPCGSGSRGFIMAINPFTGARYGSDTSSYFDVNGDGEIDERDAAGQDPNSGIGLEAGGSGLIGIGNNLYSSLDDAGQVRLNTVLPSGTVTRVTWREILLNMTANP